MHGFALLLNGMAIGVAASGLLYAVINGRAGFAALNTFIITTNAVCAALNVGWC